MPPLSAAPHLSRHRGAAREVALRIRSGRYPVGAMLPSVRELAQELGISTHAVHRAVKLLAGQGLVAVEHGVGMRILADRASPRVPLLLGCVHPYPSRLPFAGIIQAHLADALATHGDFAIVRSSEEDPAREEAALAQLAGLGVQGLLLWPASGSSLAGLPPHLPVALLDRDLAQPQLPRVLFDWEDLAAQVAAELVRTGVRRALIPEDPLEVSGYRAFYTALRDRLADSPVRADFPALPASRFAEAYIAAPAAALAEYGGRLDRLLAQGHEAVFSLQGTFNERLLGEAGLARRHGLRLVMTAAFSPRQPWSLSYLDLHPVHWEADLPGLLAQGIAALDQAIHAGRQTGRVLVPFTRRLLSPDGPGG